MTKPKPDQPSLLRVPRPKKLGLTIRQPLRMPHEDLIHPEPIESEITETSAVVSQAFSQDDSPVISSVDSEAETAVASKVIESLSAVESTVRSLPSSSVESAASSSVTSPVTQSNTTSSAVDSQVYRSSSPVSSTADS